MTCISAGTLASFSQPAADTMAVTSSGAVTSAGSVTSSASALLRSLSRSGASATMTSSSSTETPVTRQSEVGSDVWRLREPVFSSTYISSSTSTSTSISGDQYVEEARRVVGDRVERMMTGDWQHLKPLSTHRYVGGTTSPSDTEHRLISQSSCVSQTYTAGTLRSPSERITVPVTGAFAAWHQDPQQRLELPPTSVTSLSLYARSRDTQEMTSPTRRRAQSASVPACVASGVLRTSLLQRPPPSTRCHQNGGSSKSLSVGGWPGQTATWTPDEQKLVMRQSEEPATTTTTTTDVWRPY